MSTTTINQTGSLELAFPHNRGWSATGPLGRLFRYGLALVLFGSLLNLPLKYVLGSRELAPLLVFALQVALFLFLLVTLVISRPFRPVVYDKIAGFFLLYGIVHGVMALGEGERVIYIVKELRAFFLGFMQYFVARYYLQVTDDFRTVSRFLRLAIIISAMEFVYELVGFLVLGGSVETVTPWMAMMDEVYDFWAGRPAQQWYFPSLFAISHSVGMLAAVGVALFYADYKVSGRMAKLFWAGFCFLTVFAVGSRVFLFALGIVVAWILILERRKIVRALPTIVLFIVVVVGGIFAVVSLIDRAFINVYWEVMKHQTEAFFEARADSIDLVPAPTQGIATNMFIYIFGVGINEVLVGGGDLPGIAGYGFYGLEIRLFALLLQYGLIYLLLWFFTAKLLLAVRRDKTLLFYAIGLVPFYASMIHYLEIFRIMVFPLFAFFYAWLVTAWDKRRKWQGHVYGREGGR